MRSRTGWTPTRFCAACCCTCRRPRERKVQRFLDPAVLASISGLDLVAKTVVDGFVAGLHRSPDFGFSQEFAEYRAYSEGDDLRHVDWNVFARTGKCFLKRYRGETNSQPEIAEGAETCGLPRVSASVENALTERIIGAAIEVHRHLGPGLLETAYDECLCYELGQRGIRFQRQVA